MITAGEALIFGSSMITLTVAVLVAIRWGFVKQKKINQAMVQNQVLLEENAALKSELNKKEEN